MDRGLGREPQTDETTGAVDGAVSAPSVQAANTTVLAVPAADRAAIVVRGRDRTSWLNGLVTCDLAKLAPDAGAYGLIVEKKGRIQTDFWAAPSRTDRLPDGNALVLSVPSDHRDAILAMLDHYLIMEDAEIEARDLTFWHLHGPKSVEAASMLDAAFAGTVDLLGSGGAVVAIPADEAAGFATRLDEVVRSIGGVVVTDAVWDALRIARGIPRFGVEFDTTFYPQEASLERRAVAFDKGCYLGQEVVYMLENRGHVKRKLVALDVVGQEPLAAGAPLATSEGTVVGDVKSSVAGGAGTSAAIALVKWAQAAPGTELRSGDRIAHVRGSGTD